MSRLKKILIAVGALALMANADTGCGPYSSDSGGSSSGGGGSSAYCNTGYCYSYLEGVCCPRSSQYACNGQCYSYSGGGGCSSYKTTCY